MESKSYFLDNVCIKVFYKLHLKNRSFIMKYAETSFGSQRYMDTKFSVMLEKHKLRQKHMFDLLIKKYEKPTKSSIIDIRSFTVTEDSGTMFNGKSKEKPVFLQQSKKEKEEIEEFIKMVRRAKPFNLSNTSHVTNPQDFSATPSQNVKRASMHSISIKRKRILSERPVNHIVPEKIVKRTLQKRAATTATKNVVQESCPERIRQRVIPIRGCKSLYRNLQNSQGQTCIIPQKEKKPKLSNRKPTRQSFSFRLSSQVCSCPSKAVSRVQPYRNCKDSSPSCQNIKTEICSLCGKEVIRSNNICVLKDCRVVCKKLDSNVSAAYLCPVEKSESAESIKENTLPDYRETKLKYSVVIKSQSKQVDNNSFNVQNRQRCLADKNITFEISPVGKKTTQITLKNYSKESHSTSTLHSSKLFSVLDANFSFLNQISTFVTLPSSNNCSLSDVTPNSSFSPSTSYVRKIHNIGRWLR